MSANSTAGMQLVVCDSEDKVVRLVRWGKKRLPTVTTIVHMDPVSPETVSSVRALNWNIVSFYDMEVGNSDVTILAS